MPHAPRARRIPTETGFKLRGGPELTTIERLPVCNLLPSSWGCVSTVDREGQAMFLAEAHRDNGKRFVAHAEEKLTAFVELEAGIRGSPESCRITGKLPVGFGRPAAAECL